MICLKLTLYSAANLRGSSGFGSGGIFEWSVLTPTTNPIRRERMAVDFV